MNTHCVYWIRLESHSDIFTQGYIGVTKDFDKRMSKHYKITSKLNTHFAKSIVKYNWDNLIKTIVFTGSKEECYCKEKELRSAYQIGWNEAIGGYGGDTSLFIDYKSRINKGWNYNKTGENNPFYGKHHSEKTINTLIKNKSSVLIKTPDGEFHGYRSVARFYNINKLTAKKWAESKDGWSYESK